MEVVKAYLIVIRLMLGIVWRQIIIPILYLGAMWGAAVTGLFLFLKDFWQAAGIVSAFALYQIIQTEFNKEFFGTRDGTQRDVQSQKKR